MSRLEVVNLSNMYFFWSYVNELGWWLIEVEYLCVSCCYYSLDHCWEMWFKCDLRYSSINEQIVEIDLYVNIHKYQSLKLVMLIVGLRNHLMINMIILTMLFRDKWYWVDTWICRSLISSSARSIERIWNRLTNTNLGMFFQTVKNQTFLPHY